MPGWKISPWLELALPWGPITTGHGPSGQGHCCLLPPPGPIWEAGEPISVAEVFIFLATWAQKSWPLSGRGGVLPSGAFPEPGA